MREPSAAAYQIIMIRLACGYGRGSNRIGFTALKIAVVAPMPSPRIKMAVQAKPGFFRSCRSA